MTRRPAFPLRLSAPRSARLVGTALFVAVLGTVTLSAWAQPAGPGMPPGGPAMHGGPGPHGGPGMGLFMGGRGLDRMLDSVKATPEQRTQIKQIAERAMADLKAQHDAGRAGRDEMMTLFAAPTVDAAAVEAARARRVQQHDQASRRMTQALLEASRVLTAEQRKQIAERMTQRHAMMERHQQERRALEGGPRP